jgi:outer membrane protein
MTHFIKRASPFYILLMAVAGCVCSAASGAQTDDMLNSIAAPFADPLLVRPSVLDSGKVLPGDIEAFSCSQVNISKPSDSKITVIYPLSLSEAVDLALCNNPQVKSAWVGIKIQAAALGEASAAYLPTLTVSMSRQSDRTRYPEAESSNSFLKRNTTYQNLSLRLFDFGGRAANRQSANALLSAALSNHDAVLQKTLLGAVIAYFDATTAHATWLSKKQNEKLTYQILEATQRREYKGFGARSDTLQVVTALAKANLENRRAKAAYDKALSILVNAVGGVPTHVRLTLDEAIDINSHDLEQDLNVWLDQARVQHPAIVAARAQLKSVNEKVIVTRSEGLPTLDVARSLFQNGRPNQGLSPQKTEETLLGFTLSIPLFDGFSRTYKIRGAQAQAEQKEVELQDIEQQVQMEIIKAHADASASLENLTASQNLLDAAQNALSVTQKKFNFGMSDIVEVLNTQLALSDAQSERIRCLSDWRSSRLRLMASAGILGRSEAFLINHSAVRK